MPSHWGSNRLHIVSGSSPTGTQFLQAVGCADATRRLDPASDAVTLVTSGEGATSEGEFWESLNIACLERLPLVYADRRQRLRHLGSGRKPDRRRKHFRSGQRIPRAEDFPVRRHRFRGVLSGDGGSGRVTAARPVPALVHATCIRPYSHSLSDDEKLYKTKAEREEESRRDPVLRFPEWLISEGVLDQHGVELIVHEVDLEIAAGYRCAPARPRRPPKAPRCAIFIRTRRSHFARIRSRAAFFGRAADDGRLHQSHAA